MSLALLLSLALLAQAPPPSADRGPELLHSVRADYPPEAKAARLEATVGLEVSIDAGGLVTGAKVVAPAGHGFDASALAAVKQFVFQPATHDGQPVATTFRFDYHFELSRNPLPVNVTGVVVDADNQPVEGARIDLGRAHTLTDVNGRFVLEGVLPGNYKLHASHRGFEPALEPLEVVEDTDLNVAIALTRTAAKLRVDRPVTVTEVPIEREEIQRLPGANGDAFRVLQNLPGVARNALGVGPLIVRGGNAWDTRVYVDNTQVTQLFHFFGLYATFNSDLLEDISLQPGSFGVEHGRSIGGLVLAKTRTPGLDGTHGHVDLNVVDLSALVEAPLGKDWYFAASGRRSYLDLWLPHVVPQDALQFTLAPRYYDYQVRAEKKTDETRTFIELFGSNDRVGLAVPNPAADPENHASFDTYTYYNRLAAHDERPLGSWKLLTEASLGVDRQDFSAGEDLFFRIDTFPVTLRERATQKFGRFSYSVGIDLYGAGYKLDAQLPPRPTPGAFFNPLTSRDLQSVTSSNFGFEPAVFTELRWLPIDRLELVAGLRADYESQMHKGWLDPRLAAFYQVSPDVKLKAAAGLYHQPPNYQQGLLTKEFGNPDLLPEAAAQYSVGVEAFPWHLAKVNLDLYDEELFHLAVASNAPAPGEPPPPLYVSQGKGRSYGLELLVRHDFGEHFFGWVSYSLSRAERTAAGHEGLQQSRYDQPQHLTAVASWKFSGGWTLGARLQFVSGSLYTPYSGAVFDSNAGRYMPVPGDPFSIRLPAFFQADVRVDKKWQYQSWALTAYLDLQNVTNRQNVEGVSYNFDYSQSGYAHGLPIFPIIGLRADF